MLTYRTRKVLERITSPGLSHIACCTGPAQLVYLLSALEVGGVSLDRCTIYPYPGSAANDDLKKRLIQASQRLGIKVLDPETLPMHSLGQTSLHRFLASGTDQVSYWYCRGVPFANYAVDHLRKCQAAFVFEYYDGYRSPIVARQLAGGRLRFGGVRSFAHSFRQAVMQELIEPDQCFMPDSSLWRHYASSRVQASTSFVPTAVIRLKIRLVGELLDDLNLNAQESRGKESPGVVLTTAMFAERQRDIAMTDELRMYEDLLSTVRSVSREAPILTKTHPRTSTEKMRRLKAICARCNARLDTRQQLIEFILEESGRRDVVVIGPPTTALLNTLSFGYGTAVCPSQQFMASYLGDGYANGYLVAEDHALMAAAGVTTLNSLSQLAELLEAQKIE